MRPAPAIRSRIGAHLKPLLSHERSHQVAAFDAAIHHQLAWCKDALEVHITIHQPQDEQRIQIGLRDAVNNLRKLEAGNRRNG